MKQTLQLRLGQHLTMTPQLQQAIRLLQLSTLELSAEIQEVLDSNPLLELTDDSGSDVDAQDSDDTQVVAEPVTTDEYSGDQALDPATDMHNSDIPEELPVDSVWEDVYESTAPQGIASGVSQDNRTIDNQDNSSDTLREHLLWQMRMMPFSDKDVEIAMVIIDAIDEYGYLTMSLEDIRDAVSEEYETGIDEVEAVLHGIQNFDPVGVGARDLQECLMIQLNQLSPDTPWLENAKLLVKDHLQLLASRDFTQLMRRMKLTQEELLQVIDGVQSLCPRPGNMVASQQAEYIVPDVIVRKSDDAWKVELNVEAIPRLRINAGYAGMVKRADNSSDNTYLKDHLQEARWFLKSLNSRNETLLKVATCIVERQRGFLEHGEEAMKALVLHDIAEAVDMHESTISRVTTQKYMHTPRGIFELKYFFSSHVSTASGGECSATAIRALIKKFVAEEDCRKPLSDSKIADLLEQQGINVARRTIAKYRESVAIPSSSERKRLA